MYYVKNKNLECYGKVLSLVGDMGTSLELMDRSTYRTYIISKKDVYLEQ
jgi:translation elongation factor P/translation initiation factor 5A